MTTKQYTREEMDKYLAWPSAELFNPTTAAMLRQCLARIDELEAESADLRHDIEWYVEITTSLTTENERLRTEPSEAELSDAGAASYATCVAAYGPETNVKAPDFAENLHRAIAKAAIAAFLKSRRG